jgi:hypothetical protein
MDDPDLARPGSADQRFGGPAHLRQLRVRDQKLAPECETCGCRIVGHGLEADATYYCCDHCARKAGVEVLRDRA